MALGLYLHIPFCLQKCNYCDFVSYPITGGNLVEVFLQCLAREMELFAQELGREEKKMASLYLGGGTPTCLATGQLVMVLENCRHFFSWINGIEVTVEANPGTLSREKLQALKKSGVNRLSLGAQSFDAGLLAAMGRQHRAEDIMEAVFLAREAGFDNLNLDLIYGLPGQTLGQWEETLSKALSLQVEHLSVYGLILEPNTPWGQMVEEGILTTVDDELA
ncbi:MAG TPA: radical SAM family heme chaperone HemW, partial [Clostridia bacterium]|nr:radical SAM family heme chaperone HemW [Clostridia bacterium]